MDDVRYVFAVLTVTFMPPGMAWWLVIHPFVGFWRRVGVRRTLTIMTVLALASVGGLFVVRHALVLTDFGTHPALVALAAVLATVSVWIALRRRKHLTVAVMAGLPELEEGGEGGALITEGIYGVIRHPRYVEIAFGVTAYCVFSNYLGAYLIALATLPILHVVVLLEERELLERFGAAYAAYRDRVPRYIPARRD